VDLQLQNKIALVAGHPIPIALSTATFAVAWIWRITKSERPEAVVPRVSFVDIFRGGRNALSDDRTTKKILAPPNFAIDGFGRRRAVERLWLLGFDQTEQPVTVSEVIRMSQENVPAETIVNKMRDSRSVYRLSAAQLAQLHDRSVQDQVINYMQQTYLDAVHREQDLANWSTREMWGDHFW
jgi:hypothetical protein